MVLSSRTLLFGFYIAGIYACFLTWGYVQERITTTVYPPFTEAESLLGHLKVFLFRLFFSNAETQPTSKFDGYVFLNFAQCIGSVIISLFIIRFKSGRFPFSSLFGSSLSETKDDKFPELTKGMAFSYARIALCFALASPFGYASLKYMDYVAMNLGKSCKLIPLVLMSILIRRQKIDRVKLIGLILLTVGVSGFMLFDPKTKAKVSVASEGIGMIPPGAIGIGLLLLNLLLDGAMNTWQDEIFSTYKVSSFHMMFHLNWMALAFMSLYYAAVVPGDWIRAITFMQSSPLLFFDLILFAICGALGQSFVFATIEKFGAISLVTVTVTRKFFTILLSVVTFGHDLAPLQWLSVCLVFGALSLESIAKHKKRIVPHDQIKPIDGWTELKGE